MHIDPPRPPALMPEGVKHLSRILEAEAEYAQATGGRSAREDTELLDFLRGMDDELTMTPIEALVVLTEKGFNLYGNRHMEEHYWQATRDYVSDTVEEHGLRKDDE